MPEATQDISTQLALVRYELKALSVKIDEMIKANDENTCFRIEADERFKWMGNIVKLIIVPVILLVIGQVVQFLT